VQVEALRQVTDALVDNARIVTANDDVYDLEEAHSSDEPRVRRIKAPHLHDPEYARAARHSRIVEVLIVIAPGPGRHFVLSALPGLV
jgi:hypothetical protein